MSATPWNLRQALPDDRDFLFDLHRVTMKDRVDEVWGWDDHEQVALFEERFVADRWQVIRACDIDVGVLIVEEDESEIYIGEIQLLPAWQGRGIGSSVLRSLMEEATSTGRSLTLRVLHVNPRARALYERMGFRPFKEIETHAYLRWSS